jgi:hypothetical protein
VTLSGATANKFEGSDGRRAVRIYDSAVPVGSTFTFDGQATGAVLMVSLVSVSGEFKVTSGVVKVTDYYGISAQAGGSVKVVGTVGSPVIVTLSEDDAVAGDTNADGASTTPSPQTSRRFVYTDDYSSGNVVLEYVQSHWLNPFYLEGYYNEGQWSLTVRNSSFVASNGSVARAYGCGGGEISGNTFDGVRLDLENCNVTEHDNVFLNVE